MAEDDRGDVELEQQRAAAEEDFREGWVPVGDGRPRVLSAGNYEQALRVISGAPSTSLDPAVIRVVRDGAQPGDPLPPPERKPFITGVSDDAKVIISGNDTDRYVAVLFSHQHFPGIRFGHRFPPPSVEEIGHSTIWLKESIETGALHRMMRNPPSSDEAEITWTTW